MTTTTTIDLVNLYTSAGQRYRIRKNGVSTGLTNTRNMSYWTLGDQPLAGAVPTSSAICTKATTGAIAFTAAAGGNTLKLAQLSAIGNTGGGLIAMYDRILHCGGLDGTSAVAQTVSTTTLPSDRGIASDYSDLEWWIEHYTATGITSVNIEVVYLNQSGATKTNSAASGMNASAAATTLRAIFPLSGDTISSVTSVKLSSSTGTVGNFGVTCTRRISSGISLTDKNSMQTLDWASTALPRIYDNACLMFIGSSISSAALAAFSAIALMVEAP